MRFVLFADLSQSPAAMLADSLDAFRRRSRHEVTLVTGGVPPLARGDLDGFDAVLIHYSIFIEQARCLPRAACAVLAETRAVKLVWQQDEYRNVAGIAAALAAMRADIVLTGLRPDIAAQLYGPQLAAPATFIQVLTGYVSERLLTQTATDYSRRPLDIGYRGRTYPPWLGRLATDRVRLAREVAAWGRAHGLAVDISVRERDRLYGPAWPAFLGRCRATLTTESGASVFDRDGSLPERFARHVLRHPFATPEAVAAATYGPLDGQIDYAQVSPRLFEAIAARSLLLLAPGRYSDLVVPGRHGLVVEPGGRNAAEIVATIRDPQRAGDVIERAYAEVLLRPEVQESAFVRAVDEAIEAVATMRPCRRKTTPDPLPLVASAPPRAVRWRSRAVSWLWHALIDRLPGRLGRFVDALARLALLELQRWAVKRKSGAVQRASFAPEQGRCR